MGMLLRVRTVGPWQTNAFVLVCPASMQSVLIDPGDEPRTLAAMLEGTRPTAVLLTHSHPDHTGALEEMRSRLRVPVMAHPAFAGNLIDREIADGGTIPVGAHRLKVYYAPGHTPDQLCFAIDKDDRVIVGDAIFEGGPGKTWSHEDFQTALDTLRRVILSWSDETRCHPGYKNGYHVLNIDY